MEMSDSQGTRHLGSRQNPNRARRIFRSKKTARGRSSSMSDPETETALSRSLSDSDPETETALGRSSFASSGRSSDQKLFHNRNGRSSDQKLSHNRNGRSSDQKLPNLNGRSSDHNRNHRNRASRSRKKTCARTNSLVGRSTLTPNPVESINGNAHAIAQVSRTLFPTTVPLPSLVKPKRPSYIKKPSDRLTREGVKNRKRNERKVEKAQFFLKMATLFNGEVTDHQLEEILVSAEMKKFLPTTFYTYQIATNAIKLVQSLSEGSHHQYRSAILTKLNDNIPSKMGVKLFGLPQSSVRNARYHSGKVNSFHALTKLKQARFKNTKRRYRTGLENHLIREWAREKMIRGSGQGSGDRRIHCDISKPEFRQQYTQTGCVFVAAKLADHPQYQKQVDAYGELVNRIPKPTREELEKNSSRMIRSLYHARTWKNNNYEGERPDDIIERSSRVFWRAINERKPCGKGKNQTRQKYLSVIWSRMIHICPKCVDGPEDFRMYHELTERYNHPNCPPPEKKGIGKRIETLKGELSRLREHKQKFSQRHETKKFEAHLKNNPGVCLVYEDFGSKGKSSGSKVKMSNLILTLVSWDPTEGITEKKVKYADTFSRGTMYDSEQINDEEGSGKQDKFLYRDAWLGWFKQGLFNGFHTIIISGDNGASLKNYWSLFMMTKVWEVYKIRVQLFKLCEYHAWNRCDPHGGQVVAALRREERKLDQALPTPEAHKNVILRKKEEGKFPNLQAVQTVEVRSRHDEWMPVDIPKQNSADLVFGSRSIGVTYPEVPDIYDHRPDPEFTIQITGKMMVGVSLETKEVAVLDLRPETTDKKMWCDTCTQLFGYTILLSEHDQTNYYRCPVTKTLTLELDLKRVCFYCTAVARGHDSKAADVLVGGAHMQGRKDEGCPSQDFLKEGKLMLHQTFPARTIHCNGGDFVRMNILYKPPVLTETAVWNTEVWFLKRSHLLDRTKTPKDRVKLAEKMVAIFKTEDDAMNISDQIPWVVGVCRRVLEDRYLFYRYEPLFIEEESNTVWDVRFLLPPKEKKKRIKIEVPKTCQAIEFPVKFPAGRKNKKRPETGPIPTKTIFRVTKNIAFGWPFLAMRIPLLVDDDVITDEEDYKESSSDKEDIGIIEIESSEESGDPDSDM